MLFKSFKPLTLEAYYRSDGPTSVNLSGRWPISLTEANKLGVSTLTFKVENDEKSATSSRVRSGKQKLSQLARCPSKACGFSGNDLAGWDLFCASLIKRGRGGNDDDSAFPPGAVSLNYLSGVLKQGNPFGV
jgi:hypothetical protein